MELAYTPGNLPIARRVTGRRRAAGSATSRRAAMKHSMSITYCVA